MSYSKLLLVGVIVSFSMSCFYSCAKDDAYRAVVTVSRLDETDIGMVKVSVPDCRLIFGKEDYDPEIYREVYTDITGKYEGEWEREVSLEIEAACEIDGEMYTGASVIRLSLGTTATQEILITKEQP